MDNNINQTNNIRDKKDNPHIILDKYINENLDIKKSPLFYLLQIATDERKLKKNINNKSANKNLSGNNISLYSNQNENTKDDYVSQDIDIYLREIIDKNDNKFLSGEANLFEFLIAKYLNIEKNQISQQESLSIKIDLQIDDYNFLNEFGVKMPNLLKLSLENSVLKSISSIGTSFKNLKTLNVSNCQIEEIEGIVCFPKLETLLAANNQITDLFELTYLSNLRHLEIQNNLVSDCENLEFLNMLESIEFINISGNPIFVEIENCKKFDEFFYIENNNVIERRQYFENLTLEEIQNNKVSDYTIYLKANKSRVCLCKIS